MRRRLLVPLAIAAALAASLWVAMPARAFPDKPITLVTGYSPGGSTDILARILADRLAAHLSPAARVVVENRPGAAGVIAADWLRRQAADGHVLMVSESGSQAIAPNALVGGTRYHPVEDFTHLAILSAPPLILIVNNAFPVRTPAELMTRLREAPPGTLNYATSGVGGVLHLSAEMLGQNLGTRFVHVPYRSGALMLQSIHTGETQFGIAAIASAAAMIRDGMVRPIAVTGRERFPTFPDVPTLAESGAPPLDIEGWYLLIGPPGMPAPVAQAINRATVAALAEAPLRERLLAAGLNTWQGPNSMADARAFMVRELDKHRVIVERTGVRLQP